MAIGITDEHRQLTEVVADLMERSGGRQSARTALESEADELPEDASANGNGAPPHDP